MQKYDPKNILISLHVPKSGGTSLGIILNEWFGIGYFNYYVDHKQLKSPKPIKILSKPGKALEGICIHGHFQKGVSNVLSTYPDSKQFIATFRDPLDQVISTFYFQKKIIEEHGKIFFLGRGYEYPIFKDFETDNINQSDNLEEIISLCKSPVLDFLPFNLSITNFRSIFEKNFIHIGTSENFDKSLEKLAKKLKKKIPETVPRINRGTYIEDLDSQTTQNFYERHKLEKEIHNYIFKLNED
jgi:hypothetical protein